MRDVQGIITYYMQGLAPLSNLAAVVLQFANNRWSAKHGLVMNLLHRINLNGTADGFF